jgi:hypothetical protein
MMSEEVLLTTAYFPPAEYFSLIAGSRVVKIEKLENYAKQTYRNRCMILGSNGPLPLIVPVLQGSFHKTALKDLRIDNGRPWRELHLRSIVSSYASAPFFEYYYDVIASVISGRYTFLLDLNNEALRVMCEAAGLKAGISYTDEFVKPGTAQDDYRYTITPKKPSVISSYMAVPYTQVFGERHGFVARMSIIDVLLNNGPGTGALLLRSLEMPES